jgi:putative CocE/NonD family hydrolase
VQAVLWASSSALDTDFTAKLVDVSPDGFARNLQDGILRARYRDPDSESLLKPGEIYAFTINLGLTSNLFKAGHQIRLEISSSNFPRFDRNPNTGQPLYPEPEPEALESNRLQPALQTIFHNTQHPSHIILPVIPRSS